MQFTVGYRASSLLQHFVYTTCDLLEKHNLKIKFRIDLRIGTSEKVLNRLKEVGCEVVGFGIETGSNKILKRIRKGITREQIETTLKYCRNQKFWVVGFLMVSLPDESIDDILKTFELLNFFDEVNIQIFKIHPNTAIYDELKSRNEITDEEWFNPKSGFNTTYGNEFIYCSELFPSAILPHRTSIRLVRYGYSKYTLHRPFHVINKKGFLGIYHVIKSIGILCFEKIRQFD